MAFSSLLFFLFFFLHQNLISVKSHFRSAERSFRAQTSFIQRTGMIIKNLKDSITMHQVLVRNTGPQHRFNKYVIYTRCVEIWKKKGSLKDIQIDIPSKGISNIYRSFECMEESNVFFSPLCLHIYRGQITARAMFLFRK